MPDLAIRGSASHPHDTHVMTNRLGRAVRGKRLSVFRPLRIAFPVARGLLFSLLVVSGIIHTGCIVPIPLQAETSPPNSRPNIVVGECSPPVYQLTRLSTDAIEFV